MQEESAPRMRPPEVNPAEDTIYLSAGSLPPVPVPAFQPASRPRKGVLRALSYSRRYLDGCIELISEGRPAPVMLIMEELKRDIISQALVMSHSNIRAAAALLGLKYTTLYAQVKKYERHFLAARLKARGYVPVDDVLPTARPEDPPAGEPAPPF